MAREAEELTRILSSYVMDIRYGSLEVASKAATAIYRLGFNDAKKDIVESLKKAKDSVTQQLP